MEIIQLKQEVEELKRELKRVEMRKLLWMDVVGTCRWCQQLRMEDADGCSSTSNIAAPALTSAMALVCAQRDTYMGTAAPGKPEDTACRPPVATASSTPSSLAACSDGGSGGTGSSFPTAD